MREITTINLTHHELREAIADYIFTKTGRQLPEDVTYTVENEPQLPEAGHTLTLPLPFTRVTCSVSDIGEVLKQGQWVNVRDPRDIDRNPFQVRFGEKEGGIINYKLADSLMDPASRTYTRDELVLVDNNPVMKGDPNPHITEKTSPPTDESLNGQWEAYLAFALGKPVQIRVGRVNVDGIDIGVKWNSNEMNEMMVWDRNGTAVSHIIQSIVETTRQINAGN
jgi:hypothetical protein